MFFTTCLVLFSASRKKFFPNLSYSVIMHSSVRLQAKMQKNAARLPREIAFLVRCLFSFTKKGLFFGKNTYYYHKTHRLKRKFISLRYSQTNTGQ